MLQKLIFGDMRAAKVIQPEANNEDALLKRAISPSRLLRYFKILDRYNLEFSDDINYMGDGRQNLHGVLGYSLGDFSHELGHTIFWADKELDRLSYFNWRMEIPSVTVGNITVREAKNTKPVENEIAAVAISARLLEWFGCDQVPIEIYVLDLLDAIVNSFKLAGYEHIPTPVARKLRKRLDKKDLAGQLELTLWEKAESLQWAARKYAEFHNQYTTPVVDRLLHVVGAEHQKIRSALCQKAV